MWKKYSSIENAYNQKYIERFEPLLATTDFYITEKIHGANISFHFDVKTREYKVYSRNQEIEDLSLQEIDVVIKRDKIIDVLNRVIDDILNKDSQNYNSISEITFFGEYCGGFYNGLKDGVVIQRAEYCSKNKILFFDIKIHDTQDNECYVDFKDFLSYFSPFHEFIVPVLAQHLTFKEAFEYNNAYETNVPNLIGEQNLKEHQMICEGNVIRPAIELKMGSHRFIIKNKNSEHSDIKIATKQEQGEFKHSEIVNYLTPSRFESARSKLILTNSNPSNQEIIQEVIKDVIEEYMRGHKIEEFEKDELKQIKKLLGRSIYPLLKDFIN